MEACGSAHSWARKLQDFGHIVKLMAPQFVKPYVKTNKHGAADAEAICEAVRAHDAFCPDKKHRAASHSGGTPFRELILRLVNHMKELDRQVNELERQIHVWHRSNAPFS